ncbi:MAG TPA: glycosyl hydrolase family 28 protein [Tepidisphaeraceae bacterium]|jgi:hypothetical protein
MRIGRWNLALVIAAALAAATHEAAGQAGDAVDVVDVTALGVSGDGATSNTAALQAAIDGAAGRGGGTLRFPAGRYVTGTIQLKDNVRLHLDSGATILGSTDAADYRNVDPFMAGDGVPLGYALIVALDATNVGVGGTGTIDGRGAALAATQTPYAVRPFLMRWIRCRGVSVRDLTLRDPGAWTLHFFQCRDVTAEGLTIRSYDTRLPNNDGIDIDSCQDVRVARCDIESGDDAICLKATSSVPCRDVSVSDCRLKTRCNAIKLGTESLGDFSDIRVSDCDVRDIGMAGVARYTVDGGHMTGVAVENVSMDRVSVPVSVRLGARLKTFRAGDVAKPVGVLRDVSLKRLRATRAGRIGLLVNGIPGHPVESLTLEDIAIALPGGGRASDADVQLPEKEAAYPEMNMFGRTFPAGGAYLRHVKGLRASNVRFTFARPDPRPPAVLIDVEGATAADFTAAP